MRCLSWPSISTLGLFLGVEQTTGFRTGSRVKQLRDMIQLGSRDASFFAKRVEASGQPQVFGGEWEALTKLVASGLLDNRQKGVTKLVGRLDHGSFAVVVPSGQLDERPRTFHA